MKSTTEAPKEQVTQIRLLSAATIVVLLAIIVFSCTSKSPGQTPVDRFGDAIDDPYVSKLLEQPEATANTPAEVLASVRLNNGSCSGTILHKGEKYSLGLTAAHCARVVRQGIAVEFIDGSSSTGTIVAIDRTDDMALFVVPSDNVIGVIPAAMGFSNSAFTACGFTLGQGPKFKRVEFVPYHQIRDKSGDSFSRGFYKVKSGSFGGGDSGGGVFQNGQLVGVISHKQGAGKPSNAATEMYASTSAQVARFLLRHRAQCDQYRCRPHWLQPNVEIPNQPPPTTDPFLPPELLQEFRELQNDVATLKQQQATPGELSKQVDENTRNIHSNKTDVLGISRDLVTMKLLEQHVDDEIQSMRTDLAILAKSVVKPEQTEFVNVADVGSNAQVADPMTKSKTVTAQVVPTPDDFIENKYAHWILGGIVVALAAFLLFRRD